MTNDSLGDFTKHTKNRYEAIIVASKRARRINDILNREESIPEGLEGEEEAEKPRMEKIVTEALQEVLKGKVKFERPKRTERKF